MRTWAATADICISSELVPSICSADMGMSRQGCTRRGLCVSSSTISVACGRSDGVRCQHVFSSVSLPRKKKKKTKQFIHQIARFQTIIEPNSEKLIA